MADKDNDRVGNNRVRFPLLCDDDDETVYQPNTVDLVADTKARRYWIDHFLSHTPSLIQYAVQSVVAISTGSGKSSLGSLEQRAEQFSTRWKQFSLELIQNESQKITILELCEAREKLLRDLQFADPYIHIKHHENKEALKLLPQLLQVTCC